MSQTTPPTVDALPTAPNTNAPTVFSSLMDAFLAALLVFRTQLVALGTNVYNNAVDCWNNAVAAASSASAAAASALAASAAASASLWVTGTTYAIGDCRFSPVDFRTYRRKTNGAGATDPSSDTTNWQVISVVPYALTLIATLTPTAAANVDFLSAFSSTYDNYLIIGDGITTAGDSIMLMRMAVAGVVDTGSSYASPSSLGVSGGAGTSATVAGTTVKSTGIGVGFVINVTNVNDAARLKAISISELHQDAATTYYAGGLVCGYVAANVVTGVRFYWNSGANFGATGKIRIYGYQNS